MSKLIGKHEAGFTLIEILVVIGVIALISAIVFPIISSTKRSAKQSTCLSNIRQISLATRLYIDDYDGVFPVIFHQPIGNNGPQSTWYNWRVGVSSYINTNLECPESIKDKELPENFSWGYSMNETTHTFSRDRINHVTSFIPKELSDVSEVSRTVLIADAHIATVVIAYTDDQRITLLSNAVKDILEKYRHAPPASTRHAGGANYALIDGSVKWLKPDQIGDSNKPYTFLIPLQ